MGVRAWTVAGGMDGQCQVKRGRRRRSAISRRAMLLDSLERRVGYTGRRRGAMQSEMNRVRSRFTARMDAGATRNRERSERTNGIKSHHRVALCGIVWPIDGAYVHPVQIMNALHSAQPSSDLSLLTAHRHPRPCPAPQPTASPPSSPDSISKLSSTGSLSPFSHPRSLADPTLHLAEARVPSPPRAA